MTAATSCAALADELGLDVVGAAPAAPYDETERHIRERRARGLFGRCASRWPSPRSRAIRRLLLEGARTVVSAALCYYAPGARAGARGRAAAALRVARPLRAPARAARRARAAARRRLPRARRRERPRRPRGRRARGRRLLRQEHDADHAHARLVGRARHARHRRRARADAAARRGLRQLHALHRRVPDRRARRARRARRDAVPLVLDADARADARTT